MRCTAVLGFVLFAGCASSSGTSAPADQSIHIAGDAGGFLRIRAGDGAKIIIVPFPISRVWNALPAVFDTLDIPMSEIDEKNHIIGNAGMKAHKTLGKLQLMRLIDCGNAQGYPSAETYDIQVSIRTQAETSEEGITTIATLVQASGRPMAFAGEYVQCSTKGTLETIIADAVKARLTP